MDAYGKDFYEAITDGSYASGRAMAPHLAQWLAPTSVLDVGCGRGAWLKGLVDALPIEHFGVDGHPSDESLLLAPERFASHDLGQPLRLGRTFDLVCSLEVAEHLPEELADTFLDNLVAHGDAVLLSAAVPHQGGTHHVNEQWPQWWAERMQARGFVALDIVRPALWAEPTVSWWYRQNSVLYLREGHPRLDALRASSPGQPRALVHPEMWALAVAGLSNATEAEAPPTRFAAVASHAADRAAAAEHYIKRALSRGARS